MRLELRDLGEPSEFWNYFDRIVKIPRCSGDEGRIRTFVKEEAEKLGFVPKTDKVGNLGICISQKNSAQSIKKVVLQCHLDMVCEKNQNIMHDFTKNPLKLNLVEIKSEKWLSAQGTTLGADNGVGIAFLLTLMKKISSNALNFDSLMLILLFTIDEERGLLGAYNVDKEFIEGNFLINLDSEEDDRFTVGCAGGINTIIDIPLKMEDLSDPGKDLVAVKISIKGLIGGHSGVDINKKRANSIKLLARLLWKLNDKFPIFLNNISGGNRSNAIPREAQAIIFVKKKQFKEIDDFLAHIILEVNICYSQLEPGLIFKVEKIETFGDKTTFPNKTKDKLLHLLYTIPNGPISFHPEIANLVYTSTNLASITKETNLLKIVTSQRSLNEIGKIIMFEQITSIFKLADLKAIIQQQGDYPGWNPNFDSRLLNLAKKAYIELFKKEPIVQAIHAGLECGIFKKQVPEIDAISIGPTIEGAHSPDERLKIPSVEKTWKFLVKLLDKL